MEQVKIVIAGAGPAGIATAVEAKEAGIDPVVVCEKAGHLCDTVVTLFHEGKRVDPVYRKVKVEPKGLLSFDTESREEFLDRMERVVKEYGIDVRFRNEVQKIERQDDGSFKVITGGGLEFQAPVVVVAIGIFGKPNKPSYPIPKEIKDKVFFALPKKPITGKKVLIVGGGDSAAEAACFLAKENEAFLSYRREKFFRINEVNMCALDDYSSKGSLTLMLGTDIEGLEPKDDKVLVHFKDGRDMEFDAVFYFLGGMAPSTFLEGIGVECDGRKPKVGPDGESNIPGLFLAGDLVLDKGSIMGAFNSAKDVVDAIIAKYGDKVK